MNIEDILSYLDSFSTTNGAERLQEIALKCTTKKNYCLSAAFQLRSKAIEYRTSGNIDRAIQMESMCEKKLKQYFNSKESRKSSNIDFLTTLF